MKITAIADKIMIRMVKEVIGTGNEYCTLDALCEAYPDVPRHQIILAINLLRDDQLLFVQDSDDEPNDLCISISAVRKAHDNTLLKKGYMFLKEVRQWI